MISSSAGAAFLSAQDFKRRGARIGVGAPVLGEIVGGVEASPTRDQNWDIMCRGLATLIFWPFDYLAGWEYGRLYAELRRIGRPLQQIDLQIAAIALTLGNCTVVTYDSDFAAIPGLRVENWAASAST